MITLVSAASNRYRIFAFFYRYFSVNQNYANFVEVFSQNVENTVLRRKKYYYLKKILHSI